MSLVCLGKKNAMPINGRGSLINALQLAGQTNTGTKTRAPNHTSQRVGRKPQGYHALSHEMARFSCLYFPCLFSAGPKRSTSQPISLPPLQPSAHEEDVFNMSSLAMI